MIREAAYGLFEERGFERTTMRDLASEAGVALGTIFKHYPDKNALLVAAFADDIAQVSDGAFLTMPEEDLAAQLLHITRKIYEFYALRPSLSRVLVNQLSGLDGETFAAIHDLWAPFMGRIIALHQAAVSRSELRADADCSTAALAYWSFYFMGLQMGLMTSTFDVDVTLDIVGDLVNQHLSGLAEPGSQT